PAPVPATATDPAPLILLASDSHRLPPAPAPAPTTAPAPAPAPLILLASDSHRLPLIGFAEALDGRGLDIMLKRQWLCVFELLVAERSGLVNDGRILQQDAGCVDPGEFPGVNVIQAEQHHLLTEKGNKPFVLDLFHNSGLLDDD